MNLQRIQEEKHGISPIIATLLLILIAIAAGVIVYAYVIGFIGNSTSNPGGAQSVISVENSCISVGGAHCGVTNGIVVITILNQGTTTIGAGTSNVNVYLTDVTSGTTYTYQCNSASTTPGSTMTCNYVSATPITGFNSGDTITAKVVMSDGGTATSSVKAIA